MHARALWNRVDQAFTVAPPQQSEEEIRALEAEAAFTVQQVAATAFFLYLCTFRRMMGSKLDVWLTYYSPLRHRHDWKDLLDGTHTVVLSVL